MLIVDDHPMFSRALQTLLESDERIEVVAAAASGLEAVDLAVSAEPDVVLMDVGLPGIDGLEATRRVLAARPSARVVILSGASDDALAAAGLAAGAAAVLTKGVVQHDVAEAILAAAAGPLH